MTKKVIVWKDSLRNGLRYVDGYIKPYSLTHLFNAICI